MQDLGLSQLNNDQLLELIEQVVKETVRRGGHILAATNIQFTRGNRLALNAIPVKISPTPTY